MQKTVPKSKFSSQLEDDIREAVFRYHIRTLQQKSPQPFYFLSINRDDPRPAFLARFSNDPAIKSLSAVKPKLFEVTDKATGKRGLILSIGMIRQITPDQAKVETGWRSSGRGGTFGICLVQKQQNGWKVVYYAVRGMF